MLRANACVAVKRGLRAAYRYQPNDSKRSAAHFACVGEAMRAIFRERVKKDGGG